MYTEIQNENKRWYSRTYNLKSGLSIEIVFFSSDGLTCTSREAYLLDTNGSILLNCTPSISKLKRNTNTGNLIQAIGAYIKKRGYV